MPRIIEIVLFLTPLLSFAVWRLAFPSPTPPAWLLRGAIGFIVLMVLALIWVWHLDAGDANQPYIPDQMHDGRVVPGRVVPGRVGSAP
ncbi:DUF6111 family protein [Rhodopila sp.]|uniref:DUF6111 family protein n=1 Tax=Rhodopila sp. TaxID=2480087 RepID=UPI003D0FE731